MIARHDSGPSVFAQRVKALRGQRGLTRGDLGKLVGKPTGEMSYYEHCARTPHTKTVERFARAFHVRPEELLNEATVLSHELEDRELVRVFRTLSPDRRDWVRILLNDIARLEGADASRGAA